jgi:chaperone required for assembly of F1-ATPase
MKRAYRTAREVPRGDAWTIDLDNKRLETPARRPVLVPTQALAAAIAGEWAAQGDTIRPTTMPMMQLAATAIDKMAPDRGRFVDQVAGYAATDLVCFRVERPAGLAARQQALLQPLVDWATSRYQAPFMVTTGIVAPHQPPEVPLAIRAAVATFDTFRLAALHLATTACGSVVIGLALAEDYLDANAAWEASQLEESIQTEVWGEDAEAAVRRRGLRQDVENAARFMELLRA